MSELSDMEWRYLNEKEPGKHFVNSTLSYRVMEKALSELYSDLLIISDKSCSKDKPSLPLSLMTDSK
jgi:hypothetical protein